MHIIAHRGASGEYPENTLLAFEHAIKQQADAIEFDVFYHHSGEFIVRHDVYLEETTDGKGHFDQFSLAQLQNLDAGNNQQIITLNQALSFIHGRCVVNIELKDTTTKPDQLAHLVQALAKQIHQAIAQHHFSLEQFVISAFNHHLLVATKSVIPEIKTAALIACCPIDYAAFTEKLALNSLNLAIECLNQGLVDDAHQRGLTVNVYTVDKPQDIAFCQLIGVDGIFTNFPELARKSLL
ncbi:glycerophosphodiester phosphodiesterase [Thalassotalea sp. PLHSN55]|uniref:glycerophosphodiester phosphodiesterase n=1 Tax=Thalassotalea sp. PLHSN55 TaxID=3435888 RepID=UPI003F83A42D